VAKAASRDGNVWADDSVEVFVTGDIRMGIFHFAVNSRGVIFDSKGKDAAWNSSAIAKAVVHKGKGWTVTFAVPLSEIGGYVGKEQTWRLNLNRTKPGPTASNPTGEWSWAVMGTNDYHQVTDYGQVVGVSVPKRSDGVTRTATPPPPPPSYDKGVKAGSVTVYHRFGSAEVRDKGKGIGKTFPLAIRNSPGLKLAFLARGEGGVTRVPLNMFDRRAKDNTTPKDYRTIGETWRPVVYYCDRFRYNEKVESTVGRITDFSNVRFHGQSASGSGALHLRGFTIYRGEDTTPPAAPTGLTASSAKGGVFLKWKPAQDNVAAATYVISRAAGGKSPKYVKVGQSHLPAYVDKPPAGTYRYRVLAVDFQDNLGPWCPPVTVKNPLDHPQPQPSRLAADRLAYAESIRAIHAGGSGKVNKGVVLAFGDSLTYATNYRTSLEAHLGRYRAEAKGYPGQRTSFGKNRIDQDLSAVNPEFCLILLGTNNSKSDKAIESAMADLLAIAASCRKRGTVAVIGTIPPRGFKDPSSKPEARYNAALVKTCRANKIPVCYLFEYFQSLPDRRKLLAGDGVHWQGEGFPGHGPSLAKGNGTGELRPAGQALIAECRQGFHIGMSGSMSSGCSDRTVPSTNTTLALPRCLGMIQSSRSSS